MERGQEKNVMEGFINYFIELNKYCRDEILQSGEWDTFNLYMGREFS